ncbi:AMIN-like domain-containing (lipo)protein [Mycolicibacterium thermoresistibile]
MPNPRRWHGNCPADIYWPVRCGELHRKRRTGGNRRGHLHRDSAATYPRGAAEPGAERDSRPCTTRYPVDFGRARTADQPNRTPGYRPHGSTGWLRPPGPGIHRPGARLLDRLRAPADAGGASGADIPLPGADAAVRIALSAATASGWTTGERTYFGPSTVTADTAVITEAKEAGDFEAVLTWVVGLRAQVPFRVLVLEGPPRLVVDFYH